MLIQQVVTNVLANAIRFSPHNGTITVTLAVCRDPSDRPRRAWSVSIQDQGVGIPPDEIDDIFDKFVQSSKTRTGAGGTGLGLAIAREAVELHGGRIWAENAEHGGARFTFVLPGSRSVSTPSLASTAD